MLVPLQVPLEPCPPPEAMERLFDEAHQRTDQFIAARMRDPVPGFVPSDFPLVYAMLRTLRRRLLPAGNRFCEWGSGFGVVACTAALLGFESYGIEVDPQLVAGARQLASDFQVPVEFFQGSFVPEAGARLVESQGEFHWLVSDAASVYEDAQLEPADFDVVFAYPWPGEEPVLEAVFDRFCDAGAILVTYHGSHQLQVQRKSPRSRRRT